MMDLYKILDILTKRRVYFCFQSNSRCMYYNMEIMKPDGKTRVCINDEDLNRFEAKVKKLWGHVLNEKKPLPLPIPF